MGDHLFEEYERDNIIVDDDVQPQQGSTMQERVQVNVALQIPNFIFIVLKKSANDAICSPILLLS